MYLILTALLHLPVVQGQLGAYLSETIGKKLGTTVHIGRIDLGFFNRLIIDDVQLDDQQQERLLTATRLSVKLDLYNLAKQRIDISSIQLFGMKANIYKDPATAKYNFQFIADSLQSKDKKESAPLDLQIKSLIIRNGSLSLRQQKEHLRSNGKLSPRDIELSGISTHMMLNKLTDDSLSLKIKCLSMKEQSGADLRNLTLHLDAGRHGAALTDMRLTMPGSDIAINRITASYTTTGSAIEKASLQYDGGIEIKRLSPADLGFIMPRLRDIQQSIVGNATFRGTSSSLRVSRLALSTSDRSLDINADGTLRTVGADKRWNANIKKLFVNADFIHSVCHLTGTSYPSVLNDGKAVYATFTGTAGGYGSDVSLRGDLTTAAGRLALAAGKSGKAVNATVATDGFNVKELINSGSVGLVAAKVKLHGTLPNTFNVNGVVSKIEFNSQQYEGIRVDATTNGQSAKGMLAIDDRRGRINIQGALNRSKTAPMLSLRASIRDLMPSTLGLLKQHSGLKASLDVNADIKGSQPDNATGSISISDIVLTTKDERIAPADITITSTGQNADRHMALRSGFGSIDINGQIDYKSLVASFTNIVAKHIHSLPNVTLKYKKQNINNFNISAYISDTHLLKKFAGIDLTLDEPLTIVGTLTDRTDNIDLSISAPAFTYNGAPYKNATLHTSTAGDELRADIMLRKLMDNGKLCSYALNANAADNKLTTTLRLNDNEEHPVRGSISAQTQFTQNATGQAAAYINIMPSDISIGDTTWHVMPSQVEYSKNNIRVDNFKIYHDSQNITIDGRATDSPADSIDIHLKDIDISYILNLVNFHSVEFSGMATGKGTLAGIFAKEPKMRADLTVSDFKFENGRMGTLHAHTQLNNTLKQIDISATADDEDDRHTIIEGYVSPQRGDISLNITAERTRLEFMKSFCSSFMGEIEAEANGSVLLFGPLSNINLRGRLVANGSMEITSLNTKYTLHNGVVRFIPDAIIMENDTITDRNGNIGIVSGKLGHQHLTRLTYDLDIKAANLLAYDTHTFGDNTFYGTAFVTGDCKISGRSGEVSISVNGTPQKGSIIVYNVASPDAIATQDFLTWTSRKPAAPSDTLATATDDYKPMDVASDMHINFLMNLTPDATIKLLMDDRSGDYITLNGHGTIKANYFNKGNFDMFGNYTVDTGHYRLTVQNFLKRDFMFKQGGTINFGGNPYSAILDLNAVYTLASVSLADLNIGKSFTSNNTRVDCIMNITGTPASPHVDFSLDVPTISADARQMIYSLMNSEEEMNQQVLYLLAVGRFLNQGRNNAGMETAGQQSQASLAMQSLLSGTIMQQINDVIGNLTTGSNWNFGANISTGTEGFNNAEYEGLLSGSLLSGRLLVDGQFGYRDKANASTSFIGDFDLKYLLYPNGNLAINFYNKTNDRYFTRNSLTTQGLGLLLKKDFSSLSDLFGWRRKKPVTAPEAGSKRQQQRPVKNKK